MNQQESHKSPLTYLNKAFLERYPEKRWLQYASPEDAGFSLENLQRVQDYCNDIGSSGIFIVRHGAVVTAWGDISRRFKCHSIRKSFMSALYGTHVAEGHINLNKTLAELNIGDEPPLLESEKQARIIDLLKSMSGIYHPGAYEESRQEETRPKRESHKPGTHYWYNNWDFNALCPIFEKETGTNFFEEFQSRIAHPLQMEDFRPEDTHYRFEKRQSMHPAYLFRMSARDLARFGLLYLREGNWQNRQIIPKQWVWVSTTPHTWEEHCGHGYCWDILRRRLSVQGFGKPEVFAATGWGGHIIAVYPEFDMVIVNRTDTYRSEGIDGKQLGRLLLMVLDALQDSALSNPRLIPFEDPTRNFSRISLTPHVGKGYTGEYELADGSTIELREKGKGLVCVFVSPDRGVGTANLLPLSEKSFIIEDFNMPMHFEVNDSGNPVHFIWEVTPDIVWKGRLKKQMKNA